MMLIKKYRKRSLAQSLSMLLIFILGLLVIFPRMQTLAFFNYLWVTVMLLWIFVIFITKQGSIRSVTVHGALSLFFIFYTIIIPYLSGNDFVGNRYLSYFEIIIFYWAYRTNKNNDNLLIVFLLSPFILFTSFQTLIVTYEIPGAARAIKLGLGTGFEYMNQGVGGYDFIYSLIFLVIILFYYIMDKSMKYRTFFMVIFLLFLANIVFANFTIALLLVFVGLLIRIFLKNISFQLILLYTILIMMLVPILFEFIVLTIDFLANNFFKGNATAARLLEIKELLTSNIVGADMIGRLNAYKLSIDNFLEHPIFGSISENIMPTKLGYSGFGEHSFFLDTFAIFGLIIGVLQLYVFLQPLYRRLNKKIYGSSSLPLSILIVAIVLLTINNLAPATGFILFFIYPTIHDYILASQKPEIEK